MYISLEAASKRYFSLEELRAVMFIMSRIWHFEKIEYLQELGEVLVVLRKKAPELWKKSIDYLLGVGKVDSQRLLEHVPGR